MSEPLLKIENLEVKLFTDTGVLPVIDHLNLEVEKGEIIGIVGESGCGKSMLASAIMGLIDHPGKITGGRILFEEQDLTKLNFKQYQKIRGSHMAMIFQEPMTSLNPLMKCGRQIEEAVLAHEKVSKKEAKKRAMEVIQAVGIPMPETIYRSIPSQLSGGMRQRIMIAMALACHPQLLICDEPTTALDVTIQAQILKLILKLRDETNTAVIFISHDMGVISEMADRVAVMYTGQIVEEADEATLFSNPLHPYTKGLQNAIPKIDGSQDEKLHDIAGSVPMLSNLPEGCLFHPRCPFATDKCREERPELKDHNGHSVRCFAVKEKDDAEK